ncbi:AAA family ATPase [Streptomyces sp. NPDC001165]|uniref:helix-turn-helix transcriptional regulator n=1 Tax=Streptomyces sp. NPDC001165 TaxID=3364546 RepID=UPI003689BBBD
MVGRAAEWSVCRTVLDKVADGTTTILTVAGDPGTGKTRLLSEIAGAARDRGLHVRSAAGDQAARIVPFGLMADALDSPALSSACGMLPATDRARLRTVFPSLGKAQETAGDRDDHLQNRRLLHRSVELMLERLVMPPGLVLLLDDVHAADDASLAMLTHLVRQPPAVPFVLVVAYRPRQICRRLAVAIGSAPTTGTDSSIIRLQLDALSDDETAVLIGDAADPARRELLAQAGANNPFYITALSAMSDADLAGIQQSPVRIGPESIPHSARAALLTEVDALPPRDRSVASALAVTGLCTGTELIGAITGLAGREVEESLDALVAADLMRPVGSGLRFRHPLLEATLYHATKHAWRRTAHRLAAEYLEGTDAPIEIRAHHVERFAQPGDRAASAVLVEAARTSGPVAAVHFLRLALGLLPEDDANRRALRFMLARALGMSGQAVESRILLHELLAEDGTASRTHRTDLVAFSAAVDRLLGRFQEAAALVEAELLRSEDADVLTTAPLHTELASAKLMLGQFCGSAARLAEIRQIAADDGDRSTELGASAALGLATVFSGDTDNAVQLVDRCCWLLDSLPDGQLADALDSVTQLAWTLVMLDRYGDALRHAHRGIDVARRTGRRHLQSSLHLVACQAYARLGNLDSALAHGAQAEGLAVLLGDSINERMSLTLRTLPTLLQEGPLAATQLVERALMVDGSTDLWWRGVAVGIRAVVRLAQQDAEGCLALLVDDQDEILIPGTVNLSRWYLLAAQAEVARGDVARATVWSERCCAIAARLNLPGSSAQAHSARATVLLATGEPEAALAEATRAVRICDAAAMRMDEAQARRLAAAILAGSGHVQQAQEQLGIAKQLLQDRGAAWAAAGVTQEQRRLGARQPRPAGRAHEVIALDRLSERERQIAHMVSEGLTNRQIGERLFLSPRTVETHLTKIFAKVGVATRVGLVRLMQDTVKQT